MGELCSLPSDFYFSLVKQGPETLFPCQAQRDAVDRIDPDKQITNFKNYDYGKEDNRFR